jgi:hypothetical protein
MSAKGPSLITIKTLPEQLDQLVKICLLQTEFHEQSSSGIMAFKETLGLSHFNLLADRYPTIENIDELARCMHKYQLSLSSLVTLNFSFSNVLPQLLKKCDPFKLSALIESEHFQLICNFVLKIFIFKKIRNHLIPYKINLENELKHGDLQKLTDAALFEIQQCKEQIPVITLQSITEGLKTLEDSVVHSVVKHLRIPEIPSLQTTSKDKPILKILRKEIKNLDRAIEHASFDIETDPKVFSFVGGFLESLFSLLHILPEFKVFQQQLKILKQFIQEVDISKDSTAPSMTAQLTIQIQKFKVESEESAQDSWESFDLSNKKLVPVIYDGEPDWDEITPATAPSAITPSYHIAQVAASGDTPVEVAKVGDDRSSSTLTISKMS